MRKSIHLAALISGCALASLPARAQDASDRALLATFCDTGNIAGNTCKRARFYPNAPQRGCEVTLNGDHYRGRFGAEGNPLLVASYGSGCESHATDDGGVALFEQVEGKYVFRGFRPGMQGTCITLPKDAQQDALVCLTGHMGQGILDTGVALMKFAIGAKGIALSFDFLVRAEETTGAFGANIVTCKAKPPKYFELDKLKAGPRPMTVRLDASWADPATIRTACGEGFPRPEEAIGDPLPGDAWLPDDRMKRGTVVLDVATRKVVQQ